MAIIVTGDDSVLPVELTNDGATFPINSNASIRAAIVSRDRRTIILQPVDVLESAPNSNWGNSFIVIQFASSDTSAITHTGKAVLEIQVDDGGKQTWFGDVNIVKGTIS